MIKGGGNNLLSICLGALTLIFSTGMAVAEPIITFTTHVTPKSMAYKSTYLLLTEAFNRIGYQFSMKTLPGKRSLYEANRGSYDGEAHRFTGLNDNNDYPNLIKVPEIQQVIQNAMYSKRALTLTMPWQALAKYSVTVPRGSIWLTKMAKKHAKDVQELSSHEKMLNFIKYDRADIALMSVEASELLSSDEFESSGIKRVGPILSTLSIYSFMHIKHKALVPQLAFALHQMKLDGSYQRLIKQSRLTETVKFEELNNNRVLNNHM